MASFIFTTMQSESNTYDGPSGRRYVFYKGQPTIVDPNDESYFERNHRFEKVGRNYKAKPEPSAEEELSDMLFKIKGVSKANAQIVAEAFGSKAELEAHVQSGNLVYVTEVPASQLDKITKAFTNNPEE